VLCSTSTVQYRTRHQGLAQTQYLPSRKPQPKYQEFSSIVDMTPPSLPPSPLHIFGIPHRLIPFYPRPLFFLFFFPLFIIPLSFPFRSFLLLIRADNSEDNAINRSRSWKLKHHNRCAGDHHPDRSQSNLRRRVLLVCFLRL